MWLQTFHMGVVRLEGSGWRGPCHRGGDGGRSAEPGVILHVWRLYGVVIGKKRIGNSPTKGR